MAHTLLAVALLLGLGAINGANHNFPLLLPLSIQNIWASIQNVWCAPPIEYFILLLSHNDTDKYLLYYGDSRVITSSFLQHRRRSRSSRLSPYEIHGPRISHTFCMGISLIHFVWGFLPLLELKRDTFPLRWLSPRAQARSTHQNILLMRSRL